MVSSDVGLNCSCVVRNLLFHFIMVFSTMVAAAHCLNVKKKTTHAHLSFVLVSRGIRLDVLLFLQLLSDAYSHSVP